MIFRRRTALLLLLAVILLSLAIRYPLVEHERFQTDSYFIHILSNDIVREGQASWTFNPLSYVGYYPFSYPSGAPFVLGELSIMTGLDLEVCILLTDALLAVLFCLVIFCFAREFMHRVELVILVAFLAVIAPRFVDTTYWNGSARGMGVVLISLLMLSLLRAGFSRSNMLMLYSTLIGFACFAVHHMAVLIILFGAGFVFSVLVIRYLSKAFQSRRNRWVVTGAVIGGVIGTLVILSYFEVLGNAMEGYGETGFFDLPDPILSTLVNLGVSYTHQIGIVLPLAAFGVIALLRAPRPLARAILPLTTIIVFVPVLGSSLYVSMLLSPFVVILGVVWLQKVRQSKRVGAGIFLMTIATVVAVSLVVTMWSVDRWNHTEQRAGDFVLVGNDVFNDAAYLQSNAQGVRAVCNGATLNGELSAYSRTSFLGWGIEATINGDVDSAYVNEKLTKSSTPFPGNLYTWFTYTDSGMVSRFVFVLMLDGVGITQTISDADFHSYTANHSNLLVVVDNNWPTQYATEYGPYNARLLVEVHDSRSSVTGTEKFASYCLYSSQRSTIYMVQLP